MKRSSYLPTALTVLALGFQSSLSIAAPADTDKERNLYESGGVVSGIAVGALAGGPVGAVLSAAGGGWLGNKLYEAKLGRVFKAELSEAQQQLAALQKQHDALQQRYLSLNEDLEQRKLLASSSNAAPTGAACCSDSELTLHFRSNSSELETHYLEELRGFVQFARNLPDVTVEISGHADRRGESAANLALSQRRVQAVESSLRDLGLRQARFRTSALGEQKPLTETDSIESNFFDRRVQVRLRSSSGELLTQNRR